MAGKLITGAVLLGAVALAAWLWRDTPVVRSATARLQASSAGRWVAGQAASLTSDRSGQGKPAAVPHAAATLHKCSGEAGITYTNGACPPGSRQLPVDGAVTVMPAVRAPAPPEAAASGPVQGPLAELAGPPLQGNLKDKHLDSIK
jgi:hypothetical protein